MSAQKANGMRRSVSRMLQCGGLLGFGRTRGPPQIPRAHRPCKSHPGTLEARRRTQLHRQASCEDSARDRGRARSQGSRSLRASYVPRRVLGARQRSKQRHLSPKTVASRDRIFDVSSLAHTQETQHAVSEPGGDRQAKGNAPLRLVSDGHDSDPTLMQSKCHDISQDRQQKRRSP